jgi:thiamine biosynthesis lipoprotein
MKQTKTIMGMPITIEIVDATATDDIFDEIFGYFAYVDGTFSTYKPDSEIMRINRGELAETDWSDDMKAVFAMADRTKQKTDGYFDIRKPDGNYDPSGIVKGWAIQNAAAIAVGTGFQNFYIDAGGDVQTSGVSAEGKPWSIGIKNPFNQNEIVKVLKTSGGAVATSGTYIRGLHIYNPKTGAPADEIVSLTVAGSHIYDADLIATAAFAMGKDGISFVEQTPGFEGYSIDKKGISTMTSGFQKYIS